MHRLARRLASADVAGNLQLARMAHHAACIILLRGDWQKQKLQQNPYALCI